MDVTAQNFEDVLKELQEVLPTARFVAIDEEMTGISLPGEKREELADTPQKRYSKMRKVAGHYSMIQFGLAVFHEKEEVVAERTRGAAPSAYTCRVYNFYVFPQEGAINMDGAAVKFNRDHGMDWNKWVREGLTYVNRAKAAELRKVLAEHAPDRPGLNADGGGPAGSPPSAAGEPMVLTREADIDVTTRALDKLKEWLSDESRKEETQLELITTNGYLRRFMHQQLAAYPALQNESQPVEGKRGISTMIVKRFNNAEQLVEEKRRKFEIEQRKVNQKLGFFRLYELLCESNKPVVGHAIGYDLLFLLAACEGELPEDYYAFKDLARKTLGGGGVYDTQFVAKHTNLKFIGGAKTTQAVANGADSANTGTGQGEEVKQRFGSMALGNLYSTLLQDEVCGKDCVKCHFPAYLWNPKGYGGDGKALFHEAGYDAYVTGRVFAMLLELERKEQSCKVLEDCKGKLSTWRTMFVGLSLSGDEEVLDGDSLLYATGRRGVTDEDLKRAMREIVPVEEADAPQVDVKVTSLDDDSAFVSFSALPGYVSSPPLLEKLAEAGVPSLPEVKFARAHTWLSREAARVSGSPDGDDAKRTRKAGDEGEESAAKRLKSV